MAWSKIFDNIFIKKNTIPAEKNNRHITKFVMVLLVIMGLALVLMETVMDPVGLMDLQ